STPAGFDLYRPRSPPNLDVSGTVLGGNFTSNVTQVDRAAASAHLQFSGALIDMNTTGSCLQRRALTARDQHHVPAAGLGHNSALDGPNVNFAAAGANGEVVANVAHINSAATCFNTNCAANIIQMNCSAGAFSIQTPVDSRGHDRAAFGFDLHGIQVARNCDCNVGRKLVGTAPLPIAHDPGGISSDVIADFVGLQRSASAIFRALVRLIANYVRDALIRSPLDSSLPALKPDVKVARTSKRAAHNVRPCAAFALDRTLLRHTQYRRDQDQQGEFGSVL